MKITEKDVSYVADLANLELTPEERQRMVKDLGSILNYIERLKELDTSSVAAMAQVFTGGEAADPAKNAIAQGWREDVLAPSMPHDEALRNAPGKDKDFFEVPKVIER
jgi:aspartyl-tRNA(Asn)/glutamyl-tRNA(Gln) amidotransferase subunit C